MLGLGLAADGVEEVARTTRLALEAGRRDGTQGNAVGTGATGRRSRQVGPTPRVGAVAAVGQVRAEEGLTILRPAKETVTPRPLPEAFRVRRERSVLSPLAFLDHLEDRRPAP